ncbi:globin domain-containing protein [Fulvivirga lutimaris]|uniref:globin domain-containing protein n=1 Tax=Fulvivirga lutimaris TaxID=1819566 RepID=UPI0012BCD38D|nr:globin domain-containing protein [Fulvivirga lutimaris]MTI39215.1 globin [Fulvivirga lutimaris]
MENSKNTETINQVEIVQKSYGRCLSTGDVLQTFYDYFLSSSPAVKEKFKNTDFDNQKKLLKHGVNLMIMFASDTFAGKSGLKRLQHSHNRHNLNIDPKYYDLWMTCLLKAVEKHDYKVDPEVMTSWEYVLGKGIKFIASGY